MLAHKLSLNLRYEEYRFSIFSTFFVSVNVSDMQILKVGRRPHGSPSDNVVSLLIMEQGYSWEVFLDRDLLSQNISKIFLIFSFALLLLSGQKNIYNMG